MGQAIHYPIRERMIQLRSEGKTIREISAELNLSFYTIRQLLRRHCKGGDAALKTRYNKCGAKGQLRSAVFFHRTSCWLKRHHKDWGAPFIRLQLSQRYPDATIPSARQMQRWFRAQGLSEPRQRKAEVATARSSIGVHDCWQVDAKERLTLGDGQVASYLSIVDERSGSALEAIFFPLSPHQPGE